MKTIRIVAIIVAIIGGVILATNKDARKMVLTMNPPSVEYAYEKHHEPVKGWYYSVESVSTEPFGKKTFIIGRNMQPKISTSKTDEIIVSLEPNDRLREIEVPNKTAGLKSVGAYFTVKTVDGKPTLIYFPNEREVIIHMLRASDTSSSILVKK